MISALFALVGFTNTVSADEAADREILRGMLATVEKGINDQDLSNAIDYFLPESVVVFQNKTVLKGPEELTRFFDKMLGESNSVLEGISSVAAISAPAFFSSPNTAIAHGTLVDEYSFRGEGKMTLESVWTTTVVRHEDNWRIASLHFSANVFDNPIIDSSKKFIVWAAAGGLVLGLFLCWIIMRRKRKSQST